MQICHLNLGFWRLRYTFIIYWLDFFEAKIVVLTEEKKNKSESVAAFFDKVSLTYGFLDLFCAFLMNFKLEIFWKFKNHS